MIRVGSAFTTMDLQSFGVVPHLFDDETIADLELRTQALVLMQNRTMFVAPARKVAAGALLLRRWEVKL